MRGMRSGRAARRGGRAAGVLALMAVLVGCAAAPPDVPPRVMQPGDFKMLAGPWTGSSNVQAELSEALRGVIEETGAFFTVPRASAGSQLPGMMRIVDGGVVYESRTSKGTMTFHETPTEWIWKWNGKTADGRYVRHELSKPK